MKRTARVVLAALTCIVASAGAMMGISACNSGSGDVVSACNGYCKHIASCQGLSGSAIDNGCKQACGDAGTFGASLCGDSSTALTNLYDCLEGLPCNDFGIDAGTAAISNCVQQSGCQ